MTRFNPSAEKLGRFLKNGCKEIQLAEVEATIQRRFEK